MKETVFCVYSHLNQTSTQCYDTAREREWTISAAKDNLYLASKGEILCHFDDIVDAVVREKDLKLVQLFHYGVSRSGAALEVERLGGDGGAHGSGVSLSFVAMPLAGAGEWAQPVTVVCKKLIDAA